MIVQDQIKFNLGIGMEVSFQLRILGESSKSGAFSGSDYLVYEDQIIMQESNGKTLSRNQRYLGQEQAKR